LEEPEDKELKDSKAFVVSRKCRLDERRLRKHRNFDEWWLFRTYCFWKGGTYV